MKKIRDEEKVKIVDLIDRRKLVEQRRDHLIMMKRKSKVQPTVKKEQREIKFEGVEQLYQKVNEMGPVIMDPSKCEAIIPATMTVNKKATLMVILRDINNNLVSGSCEELYVSVQASKSDEIVTLEPIDQVSSGRYKTAFIPSRYGDHVISIQIDGHHIANSPCK